jgi:RNA polymerase sigma-70 factor (ECF subfamily)
VSVVPSDGRRSEFRAFEQLLREAHRGSQDALGELLELFRRVLLHAAQREVPADLRSKSGASDLVQETFLDAHRDFARFTGTTRDDLCAWLRCLLRHNFANFLRDYRARGKRRAALERPLGDLAHAGQGGGRTPLKEVPSPSDVAARRESADRCRRAVERLDCARREVLRLRIHDGLSYQEIGRRLALSPEAARKLLTRTIRQVGAELGE